MLAYSAPCYTLDEAQEILSFRTTELHHAIRNNYLAPVVYTRARPMLLFLPLASRRWQGVATCTYRGHIALDSSVIESLLDQSSVKIGGGFVTLLDQTGISNWSIAYPFKRHLPQPPITTWTPVELSLAIAQSKTIEEENRTPDAPIAQQRPIGQADTPLYAYHATPLPVETESNLKIAVNLLKSLKTSPVLGSAVGVNEDFDFLELDFDKNSEFRQADLRIPISEIVRFQKLVAELNHSKKASVEATQPDSPSEGKRVNQLHELIQRIIFSEPNIGAKEMWRLIEADANSDSPLFDTDHILRAVDDDCIDWRSRYGIDQSIKWASFQSTVSKLKGKVKE